MDPSLVDILDKPEFSSKSSMGEPRRNFPPVNDEIWTKWKQDNFFTNTIAIMHQ